MSGGDADVVALLAAVVPDGVAIDASPEDAGVDDLFESERVLVRSAVPARRREFATGRRCAHRALIGLGRPAVPILSGASREPLWPAGVVGSITHCAGFRGAAVGRTTGFASIGIDAEVNGPLPEGVEPLVVLEAERRMLRAFAERRPDVDARRLLFSAKESVYKAWFPLMGTWLDFLDCRMEIDTAGGFVGILLVPGPVVDGRRIDRFSGRWAATGGLIVTAVVIAD